MVMIDADPVATGIAVAALVMMAIWFVVARRRP